MSALLLLLLGAAEARAVAPSACRLGKLLAERPILAPATGAFYSHDVLNPDVIRIGPSRYLLYFSGNNEASEAGSWHTGLAVGTSPLGPFKVTKPVRLPFLNGGTAWDGRRFYQAATSLAGPTLYRSRDGRHWQRVATLPEPPAPAWDHLRSDFSVTASPGRLEVYYAGRPGPAGADLGHLSYAHGRFSAGRHLLGRRAGAWDGLDLGEPAPFTVHGRHYLAYAGLGAYGSPRQIGLAYQTSGGWKACPQPLFRLSARYPENAIGPEPLIKGNRLYLYFGGGDRPSLGGNMHGTIFVRTYRLA